MSKAPVLFLIFNRPEVSIQVFEKIREYKPEKFYIAADGARTLMHGENEKCEKLRSELVSKIDWSCEVKTLFRTSNLGCKKAVSSGIDWFFEAEEMGIILEDDCLPNSSFFYFCEELLNYYKDDKRIMQISGNNFQFGKKWGEASYYFSKYNHIWGWASWRRAWKFKTLEIDLYEEFLKSNQIKALFSQRVEQKFWLDHIKSVYLNNIDTWDTQWTLSMWMQNGLCILPNVNLVSNIGFGGEALHTKDSSLKSSKIMTEELEINIVHPNYLYPDFSADMFTFTNSYKPLGETNLFKQILRAARSRFTTI